MQSDQPEEADQPDLTHMAPSGPESAPGNSKQAQGALKSNKDRDIHRVLWERTRRSRAIEMVLVQGILWLNLLGFDRGSFIGLRTIIPAIISAILLTFSIISLTKIGNMFDLISIIIFAFSSLLATFSTLYWNYGTTNNFSENLTRLDAVYFAVGILSTAGTGNISAISQVARGLQLLQMVIDIGFVVFAVSLAIAEISTRMQKGRD